MKLTAQQYWDAHQTGVKVAKLFRCVDGDDKCINHMVGTVLFNVFEELGYELPNNEHNKENDE